MDKDNAQLERIFSQAADLCDAGERSAFLDTACGQDQQLRAAVERLLKHDVADSFLESPIVAPPTLEQLNQQVGTTIGPYKLIEEIGEGGMGTVFMAEQREPIRRKVALKIIKPGMDTRHVIARFEAERQALAMMDHPNIAHVYDGGATEAGRPYFVMELVHGIPITDYCDEARLITEERLKLFISVCDAVQHAHQKGIIHRDIKPSNVLVTLHGDTPVVKVIDFGVAKATDCQLTEKTLFTGFGEMIGTPLYMSPEQMALSGLDVDTRSDIYSLGVLLYELLTGLPPYDKQRMRELSLEEVRRVIREEEPPKPSTRLTTVGEAASTLAESRKLAPTALSRTLQGELDWIVMKALEKDRKRRYESANEFAKDVRRYLDDEPVEACQPSTAYRLRKFARRNKTALAFVGSLALTLVIGAAAATGQAIRATKAEQLQQEQVEVAQQERDEADKQRKLAQANYIKAREAVEQMVTRVVQEHLDYIPVMKDVRRQLLQDAAAFYDELLKLNPDDPVAYFQRGHVYALLAKHDEAQADYEKAVELQPGNAELQHALGLSLLIGAKQDKPLALLHLKRAIELSPETSLYYQTLAQTLSGFDERLSLWNKAVELDPNDATPYAWRSAFYLKLGDLDRAMADAQKALELDPQAQEGHIAVGHVYNRMGEPEKALAAYRRVCEVVPANAVRTFSTYERCGDYLVGLKRYEQALGDYDKAIELSPSISFVYKRRALMHFRLKHYGKAVLDLRQAVELNADDLSNLTWISPKDAARCPDIEFRNGYLELADKVVERVPNSPEAQTSWANVYAAFGREQEAAKRLADSLARMQHDGGELEAYLGIGRAYLELTQPEKAVETFSTALTAYPDSSDLHYFRGLAYNRLGQYDEALADLTTSIAAAPGKPDYYARRGIVYAEQDQWPEAARDYAKVCSLRSAGPINWYRSALLHLGAKATDHYPATCAEMLTAFMDTKSPPPVYASWLAWTCALAPDALDDLSQAVVAAEMAVVSDSESIVYLNALGAVLYRAGRTEEAVERLIEADKRMEDPDAATHSSQAYSWRFPVITTHQLGKHEEAEQWLQKANEWTNEALPAYTWCFLAMATHRLGKHEEAEQWLQKANEWTNEALRENDEGARTISWDRRLALELLREEAEGLIGKEGGEPSEKSTKETTTRPATEDSTFDER